MESDWFERAKIVAYYLWEHTESSGKERFAARPPVNALDLWYAAEDIASFFEQSNILDVQMVDSIRHLGTGSEGYIWFVRNLAYRMYIYTNNTNEHDNWFLAEQLLDTPAWVENTVAMAAMLRGDARETVNHVRSDMVRTLYGVQTF